MNETNVVEALKNKAKSDPVAADVFLTWGENYTRARETITVDSITQRMKSHGFEHDPQEYGQVLKFLADIGIGQVMKDSKGRVKALKDVKLTRTSIGKAAINSTGSLDKFKKRNRFTVLEAKNAQEAFEKAFPVEATIEKKREELPLPPIKPGALEMKVVLHGREITIQMPEGSTAQDVIDVINRLR